MPIRSHNQAQEEIEAFVDEHLGRLLGLARLLTRTEQEAEDLVQDCLVRVVKKWPRVSAAASPLSYVRRVMVNTNISNSRTRRVSTVPLDEQTSPEGDHVADDGGVDRLVERFALRAALQDLSATQRAVVVLHYNFGMTADEISGELGLKPSSVRSALSRALHQLQASPELGRATHADRRNR